MPISLQHSGFVGSVAYKGPKVKMQGVPFTKIVSGNSKNSDRDYMAAVECGDTETAQRMVDEAAKAAG